MSEALLISVAELAELLRTTPKGVYSKIYRQEIPETAVIRRGPRGKLLFRRASIESWINRGCRRENA